MMCVRFWSRSGMYVVFAPSRQGVTVGSQVREYGTTCQETKSPVLERWQSCRGNHLEGVGSEQTTIPRQSRGPRSATW